MADGTDAKSARLVGARDPREPRPTGHRRVGTFDPDWLPVKKSADAPLILFDGVCALCNRSVQTLVEADKEGALRFAPLQGETARPILARHGVSGTDFESLVLVEGFGTDGERIHQKSEAALRTLTFLGGFWRVISWLRVVPRPMRDFVYDCIARNRYRWFGQLESCRRPESHWAQRFLP